MTFTGKPVEGKSSTVQCQAGIATFVSAAGCQTGMPAGFARVSYAIDNFITKETGIKPCAEECSGSNIAHPSFFSFI